MTSSETAVTNVLYRYAEMIDSGRFEEMGEGLFAHAEFIVAPPPAPMIDGPAMSRLLVATTIRHSDGTPATKHVITNPIVEVDEAAGTATCRSYYTVFQQTDGVPLQPIAAGRYHDRFARIDGEWCFTQRDYTMLDMIGDTSQHLRMDPRHPPEPST
ncbi:MAG: nuclear transport factor 2 family protein [Actinomycetota bacterium]|nr:nuclear transport factor 2 family protein [Actinomycetota bacterium]